MYFNIYSHNKNIRYVWRGIKTIRSPQEFYRAGTAPSVLKPARVNPHIQALEDMGIW